MENYTANNPVRIIVEDQVLPVLMSAAIEAFDHEHKTPRGKGSSGLETYGLLWGYVIPSKSADSASKIIVTTATIETSAVRHKDWVQPNWESIEAKKELIEQYWPHLELVGTFHSHPYELPNDVKEVKGWRASEGDREHWPQVHEHIVSNQPLMAHLIFTVTELKKSGWAFPTEIDGKDHNGLSFTAGKKKLWLNSYTSVCIKHESEDGEIESEFTMHDGPIKLDAPALSRRMFENN
jgi:hypothetical protein